jgi:hypothetical protein
MSLPTLTLEQQQARLLELPGLIHVPASRLTALLAEKRPLEVRIEGLEAANHTHAMQLEDYKALKNADDRKAYLRMRLEANENWQQMTARHRTLAATIDKYRAEREMLQDEHQSLRAVLQAYYVKVIEDGITDRALARLSKAVA